MRFALEKNRLSAEVLSSCGVLKGRGCANCINSWLNSTGSNGKGGITIIPNRCLSSATACLYGVCEAAILAAGYAPAVGFIHTGKPQSFVYDIADIFKFDTVVPAAFRIAAQKPYTPERDVRIACRDMFRQTKMLKRIIPTIEQVLAAGGQDKPQKPEESVAPAIPNKEQIGDAGHRS